MKPHPDIPKPENKTMIESWDDVPAFANEAEEQTWWNTHEMGPGLVEEMQPVPLEGDGILPPARPRTRTKPVPIRFDDNTLTRLKTLAARRHRGYQTIAREFIAERLYEEEKREGLI